MESKRQNIRRLRLSLDDYADDFPQESHKSGKYFDRANTNKLLRWEELITKFRSGAIESIEIRELAELSKLLKIKFEMSGNTEFLNVIIHYLISVDKNANLNWLDTSNCRDFSNLFDGKEFDGDISEWDTSKVENMARMFQRSTFNGDISKWNISSLQNMSCMFMNNEFFLHDLSCWDVLHVPTKSGAFTGTIMPVEYFPTNYYNKLQENKLSLSLDDYDDEEIETPKKQATYKDYNEKSLVQKTVLNKQLTLKNFLYELSKRLKNFDKKMFSNFGFVNYKVTGNENDWPFIVSLNESMSFNTMNKYQQIFDIPGWTTISGTDTFRPLLQIENHIFPNYRQYNPGGQLKGIDAKNAEDRNNKNWMEPFHGKYSQCVQALEKFMEVHPQRKNDDIIFIYQISFSNDGAFYAMLYEGLYKPAKTGYRYYVEVYSTDELVKLDQTINLDEEKEIVAKQRKFKRLLKKANLDEQVPRPLKETVLGEHAAFCYTFSSKKYLDFRSRYYLTRFKDAYDIFKDELILKDIKMFSFMNHITYGALYIDRHYDSEEIYEKLNFKSQYPYVVVSSKSGNYLISFYCFENETAYEKNNIYIMITDNSDFSIMPEKYLEEIKYNHIS